jgi:HD-GYP domain-containing protein (c-di-GMP phosphodiesterase class II)
LPAPLRLADLLGGLSIVADLGFGLPRETSLRSCLIGAALARKLGASETQVSDVFYTTLLLHMGCIALAHETAAVVGDEVVFTGATARLNPKDPSHILEMLVSEVTRGMTPAARARVKEFLVAHGQEFGTAFDTGACEVGRETARRIGLGAGVQRALHEIHEWWNGGGAPQGLKEEEIALPARIARVAADAALFNDLGGADLAAEALRRRAGWTLDPSIVAAFLVNPAEFLVEAHAGDPRERILAEEPAPVLERDAAGLTEVAAAFGNLADVKTTFTLGHSRSVAQLATAAAMKLRLDAATTALLEVAAHLHDIGTVGISDVIWEKPGPLTTAEWEQVRMHAYHSERILAMSHSLELVAPIAGMHHERADGSGYHRGSRTQDISVAARLLAAADAFQAMTEKRSHRAALSPAQAGEELQKQSHLGRLDADAVAAVLDAAGQRTRRRRRDLRPAGLSEREVEVLRLVAQGASNPDIAEHLSVSRRTAEHHVQHIYAKIGVSSRAAAALFSVQHGLLPASPTS